MVAEHSSSRSTTTSCGQPCAGCSFDHGLVAEGSGAAGVAAVLGRKVEISGELVVVVTGRNIAPDRYAAIFQDP